MVAKINRKQGIKAIAKFVSIAEARVGAPKKKKSAHVPFAVIAKAQGRRPPINARM